MKIVVGTYDGGLMGWESDLTADSSGRTLQLTYAFAAHDGSVRSLALNEVAGSTLVSGGSDETIRVFNLKKHTETGSLLEHKAAVTAVEFFRGSHLLSGSQDGIVCVWRTSDWLCMDNMRGHKAAVNSISIHPTGRLALSVAQDGGLIMWDLTKGKPAYSTRLPGPAQRVAWFGGGSHFLVAYDACLAVHSGASGKLLHKCGDSDSTASVGAGVYGTSRICDVAVVSAEEAAGVAGGRSSSAAAGEASEVLAYAVCGHESGEVSVWALPQGRQVRRFASGHTKRVRCVAFCDGRTGSPVKPAAGGSDGAAVGRSEPSSSLGDDINPLSKLAAASKLRTVLPAGAGPYLVTADSDGMVKLWNAAEVLGEAAAAAGAGKGKDAAAPAALATLSAAAGSRITCLAASTHGPSTTAAEDAEAGASIGSGSAAAVAAVAGASAGSAGGKPRKVGDKASRPGRHDGGKAAAGAGGVAAGSGGGRSSSPSSGGDGRAQKKQRRGSSAASGGAEADAPAAGAKPKAKAGGVTITSKKQRGGGAASAGPPAGGKAKKSVRFG